MKYTLRMLIVLMFLPSMAQAQRFSDVRAGLQLGFNGYSMMHFKTFERGIISPNKSHFPVKTMQNYPYRGSLGGSLNYIYHKTENSLQYMFHSTGSRYHYADYSGQMGLNSVIKSHSITGATSLKAAGWAQDIWRLYAGAAITNHFGTYSIHDFLMVGDFQQNSTINFRFQTLSIEPLVRLHRDFGRHLLTFKLGYDIMIASTVRHKQEVVSFDSSGRGKAKAEMNGIRAELGYQIRLSKPK